MKVTVDLSENEIEKICEITGNNKKGPAIRELLLETLMLRRRAEIAGKFLTGEWSTELEGFEESRRRDREESAELDRQWRE